MLSCIWLFETLWAVAHQALHGIFLARILQWVAISSSRVSSQPRDQIHISCTAGIFLMAEPPRKSELSFSSVQFSHSVMSDSLRPHELRTPGPLVHHQLPEFTQTHAHRVGDAIQPSHPLSSPSPPAHNPSQHQGLFQWVNCLNEVAKVLEFQLQHQSFQWAPRTDLLQDGLVGSPCSPRDSQESPPSLNED